MSETDPLAELTRCLADEVSAEAQKIRVRMQSGESALSGVLQKLDRLAALQLKAVDGQFTEAESEEHSTLRRWYYAQYRFPVALERDATMQLPQELRVAREWLTQNVADEQSNFERLVSLFAAGQSEQDFAELRGLFARFSVILHGFPLPPTLKKIGTSMLVERSMEQFQLTAGTRAKILGTFVATI